MLQKVAFLAVSRFAHIGNGRFKIKISSFSVYSYQKWQNIFFLAVSQFTHIGNGRIKINK